MQLRSGVIPAMVTPFLETGEVDDLSVVRLISRFESYGCAGVVIGGTNGEGPSLSAVERRDLVRRAIGPLPVIAGLATSSLPEAVWLSEQAGKAGAVAVLAMPPYFVRPADPDGMAAWFQTLLDRSPIPVILYHFPRKTGFRFEPEWLKPVLDHPNAGGIKDSSGEAELIPIWRELCGPDQTLWIGDEKLLFEALSAGWTGTISGVANSIPDPLVRIIEDWPDCRESAETRFSLTLPLIESLRATSQPSTHKALLAQWGWITDPSVRPPLVPANAGCLAGAIEATLGPRHQAAGFAR